jgi:hypothetical protein
VLSGTLTDSDQDLRSEAASAIGALARRAGGLDSHTVVTLIERMDLEPQPRVRYALLQAIEHSRNPSAQPALMSRLPRASPAWRERLLEAIALLDQLSEGPSPPTPGSGRVRDATAGQSRA